MNICSLDNLVYSKQKCVPTLKLLSRISDEWLLIKVNWYSCRDSSSATFLARLFWKKTLRYCHSLEAWSSLAASLSAAYASGSCENFDIF